MKTKIFCAMIFMTLNANATDSIKVRDAKINLVITKASFTKNSTGTFDEKRTTVCKTSSTIPVFQITNSNEAPTPKLITCAATLGKQTVNIIYGGYLFLEPISDPMSTQTVMVKTLSSFLHLEDFNNQFQAPPNAQSIIYSTFATKDLGLKSFLQELWPDFTENCSTSAVTDPPNSGEPNKGGKPGTTTCTVNYPEFFDAYVEVQDAP